MKYHVMLEYWPKKPKKIGQDWLRNKFITQAIRGYISYIIALAVDGRVL